MQGLKLDFLEKPVKKKLIQNLLKYLIKLLVYQGFQELLRKEPISSTEQSKKEFIYNTFLRIISQFQTFEPVSRTITLG